MRHSKLQSIKLSGRRSTAAPGTCTRQSAAGGEGSERDGKLRDRAEGGEQEGEPRRERDARRGRHHSKMPHSIADFYEYHLIDNTFLPNLFFCRFYFYGLAFIFRLYSNLLPRPIRRALCVCAWLRRGRFPRQVLEHSASLRFFALFIFPAENSHAHLIHRYRMERARQQCSGEMICAIHLSHLYEPDVIWQL